jgi:hypothetical protein
LWYVWVIVGLAAFAGLAIGSLFVPVVTTLEADTAAGLKASMHAAWLFGLVRTDLTRSKGARPGRRRQAKPRYRAFLRVLRVEGLAARAMRLAKDVFATVKVRTLSAKVRLGLSDPAEGGMLFGIIFAVRPFLRLPPQVDIDVRPAFSGEDFFEGRLHCELAVQPIKLFVPFGRFALSRPGRKALRLMVFDRG